ncbi:hypothetical protein [Streptomyces sp. NE5-10]|uniref:hypothetical protein n=1 Tax=Streptomyces sp. NE5-10 TaxID=2759674 RepID=UPI0027DC7EE8|nr:hypothetical protein [Streptomyces sp. NE5-10]
MRGTTTDYFFARSLVAAGTGVSLIPSIALTPELPGLSTVPITSSGPVRHIGVATIGGRDRPHLTTLLHSLREEAKRHDGHRFGASPADAGSGAPLDQGAVVPVSPRTVPRADGPRPAVVR